MQSAYSTAPTDWDTGHSLVVAGGSYLSAEMQSAYSTAPTDWDTGLSLRGWGLTSLQKCNQHILQCQQRGTQVTRWWEGVLPSVEMQSAYSTAPADWDTGLSLRGWGLTSLQKCNQRILQCQQRGTQVTRWWEGVLSSIEIQSAYSTAPTDWDTGHSLVVAGGSYLSAEMQSAYSTAPADWDTGHSLVVAGGSYLSAEMQSAYSTAPVDWDAGHSLGGGRRTLLPLCRLGSHC